MKRILLILTTILTLLVGQAFAFEEFGNGYKMYVKAVPVKTNSWKDGKQTDTVHNEYHIYIGTEETEKMDEKLAKNRMHVGITFIHPTDMSGYKGRYPDAPGGWYAQLTDTTRGLNMVAPLFRRDVWGTVPSIVRHILIALDYKDKNLIMISTNALSGSISIFYHPKFDRFKIFYDIKLKILERYFDKHDFRERVPILIEPKIMV